MIDRRENKKKELLQAITEKYNIGIVYLFGSQAEIGKRYIEGYDIMPDASSDLDIAVVFRERPENEIKAYGLIYLDLSKLFDPFEIDLVFLHELNAIFRYEIIKGIRVYAEDEQFADSLEEAIMKEAEDLLFKRKEFYEDIMEAIRDGYFEFEYSPPR